MLHLINTLNLDDKMSLAVLEQIIVDDDANGSGVLICENLVLSAAHVFYSVRYTA